jgi:hypothetical protein
MKKQSPPQVPSATEAKGSARSSPAEPTEVLRPSVASALDPSEITVVLLETEDPPVDSGPEASVRAVPGEELDRGRTADIPPALLPDAKPGSDAPPATPRKGSPPAGSQKFWLGLIACLLLIGGGATFWFLRSRPAEPPLSETTTQAATPNTPEEAAPELRAYLDQAKAGDAKAMHMIALMYWNGLNVRQDRVKGLDWYRKAVAAGDKAAQKELSVIEGK